MKCGASPSAEPTVSKLVTVVIPVLNEERYLPLAIEAILTNGYPLEQLRILVIDGGSEDNTIRIIEKYSEQWPGLFELVVSIGATVYQSLGLALELTKTEYFVRVDARSIIPVGYIARCLSNLSRDRVVGAGGVQDQFGTSIFSKAVVIATSHPFGVGNASFRIGRSSGYVDTVYLGAYRTADLRRVGGYDVTGRFLSEDSSINARLRDAGGLIYLDVGLRVKYPAKESPTGLLKQYLIYGAARAASVIAYGKFTSWRQLIPIVFLLALIMSAALSPFSAAVRSVFFGLLTGYFVLNVCISAWLSSFGRVARLSDLCRAFAIMHFSWPIGFLVRICCGEVWLAKALNK